MRSGKSCCRWNWLCLALLGLLGGNLSAQASLRVVLAPGEREAFYQHVKDFRPKPIDRRFGWVEFSVPDTAAIRPLASEILLFFQKKAFLSASLDSLRRDSAGATARLHLGPAMQWVSLRPADSTSAYWAHEAGFREKMFRGKPLRAETVAEAKQKILETAENSGYPFAAVWLDSLNLRDDGRTSALLRVQPNRFFLLKTLKVNGDLRLPKPYLPNYLDLKSGTPYSRAQLLRLRDQLAQLPFVEVSANPTVTFTRHSPQGDGGPGEATINLFLRKKRANRFDFIIGLLPRSDNASDKRLLVTGSLSAAFQNALNLGERFSVELERLKPETQRLETEAALPYLLGTSFGADARLHIFRRDSSWLEARSELGIQYLLGGADLLRVFWENKSSSLQSVDTLSVIRNHRLPPNLDYRQNAFGLESRFERLDYRFNPRKGWSTILRISTGFNTVRRNPQIESLRDPENPAFDFASLYDTLTTRTARHRLEGQGEIYLPAFERTTVKIAARGGGIFSKKPVFANEQYRLGGNRLLRGFDEESLFATRFLVATAEWRLLLSRNAYLAAFADYAYLENVTDRMQVYQHPLGLGAGMTFETKAGLFGISMAIGKRDKGQPIDWRAPKFHLGYVNLF